MTLLDRLKAETRPAHDRIERAMDLDGRLASPAAYRDTLARFLGFHRAWEAAAAPLIDDAAFFGPRRKTGLLERDLRALGLSEGRIAALPSPPALAPPASRAAAWGALYVMEGSTLGGAVIARLVERRLGLDATTGCAYFRGYGPATGAMWTGFKARLLGLSSPAVDDEIVAAADRTFAVLEAWLCGDPAARAAPLRVAS